MIDKNNEFYIPFIKSLMVVAMVTIVSMGIAHYFISDRFLEQPKSPVFTSSKSQISVESPQ